MRARNPKVAMNFKGMQQADVPQGRNGRHKSIVTKILSDLDRIKAGMALKVPLSALSDGKEKVRSALNRATRKEGRRVATASDDRFLYIWNLVEGKQLEFRTEFFNAFNHPQYGTVSVSPFAPLVAGGPAANVAATLGGRFLQPQFGDGGARIIRYLLKLTF